MYVRVVFLSQRGCQSYCNATEEKFQAAIKDVQEKMDAELEVGPKRRVLEPCHGVMSK